MSNERTDFNPARRLLLKQMAVVALAASTGITPDNKSATAPFFDPWRIGLNINTSAIRWYNLDITETIKRQLELPVGRVRLPVRFDEVFPEPGVSKFDEVHRNIDQILNADKEIDIQFGPKSVGGREVNLGYWIYEKFPYLRENGVLLDKDPDAKKLFLDLTYKVAGELLPQYPEIVSIQGSNEPLSKRLDVANYRRFSPSYVDDEIDVIRSVEHIRPMVTNIPWDTPSLVSWVLKNPKIDIAGLNIYNNIYPGIVTEFLWKYFEALFILSRINHKSVFVTEYQTAPWLNNDKTVRFSFNPAKRLDGFRRIRKLNPGCTFLWDLEQHILLADNGNNESQRFISSLKEMVHT